MVSVGLNATDERKKVIDFWRGYVPYTSVLASRPMTTRPPTIDNCNKEGVTITALQGSTGEALVKETFPNATVNGFPDQNAALLEVATGRAQGSVVEDYILAQFSKSNPDQLEAGRPRRTAEPLLRGVGRAEGQHRARRAARRLPLRGAERRHARRAVHEVLRRRGLPADAGGLLIDA